MSGVIQIGDITVVLIADEMHHPRMRGDLHTLKRVCSYASVVMLVGEVAFIILAVGAAVFGALAFTDDDMRSTFVDVIKCNSSDISVLCSAAQMVLAFLAMFITVKVIHDIMVSIQREHSPFMEDTPKGFKLVCMTFLILSVPMTILEYGSREYIVLAIGILLLCILISVVMYCLTIIFRYGHLLQDESDHTL